MACLQCQSFVAGIHYKMAS